MIDNTKIPIDAVQELADKSTGLDDQISNKISIDADYVRNTNCQIGMLCHNGMITESTFISFIKFANVAKELGINWCVETIGNEKSIPNAKNTLVAKFLERRDLTHLVFIDNDIGWEPWHLLLLLDRRKEVIGGLYPMKTMPIKWAIDHIDNAEMDTNGLQEVSTASTGFLCIKREVFEKLKKHKNVIPYANNAGINEFNNMYTFFDTSVNQGRYLNEDYTFCENYRDLGGKIYIDKRVLLSHHGSMVYSVETHDQLLSEFSKLHIFLSAKNKNG